MHLRWFSRFCQRTFFLEQFCAWQMLRLIYCCEYRKDSKPKDTDFMWVHTQMNRSCVIAIRTSYNAHNRTSALMNICLMVFPDEGLKKDRNTYFLSALCKYCTCIMLYFSLG